MFDDTILAHVAIVGTRQLAGMLASILSYGEPGTSAFSQMAYIYFLDRK